MDNDFPPLAKSNSSSTYLSPQAEVKTSEFERERTLAQPEFDKLAKTPEPSNKSSKSANKPKSVTDSHSADTSPRDLTAPVAEKSNKALVKNNGNSATESETKALLSNIIGEHSIYSFERYGSGAIRAFNGVFRSSKQRDRLA